MPQYHKVEQGDCLASIAFQYGFNDYTTIWNDPKNGALQQKRKNPNILAPDDIVFIPDKQNKNESRGSGQQHSFQIKKPTIRLRIALKDASDEPLANLAYMLKLSDQILMGTTDGTGILEQNIPVDAASGEVTLKDSNFKWTLQFGLLNPVETISGVQARLQGLGYAPGSITTEDNEATQKAVRAFQQNNDLPVTGTADAQTWAKLKEIYGS